MKSPFIADTAYPLRKPWIENKIFRLNTMLNTMWSNLRFKAPAKPYKTINIDPTSGSFLAEELTNYRGLNQVKKGSWDKPKNMRKLENFRTVKGLKERFEEGKNWKDTVLFKTAENYIEEKGSYEGYTDKEKFLNQRCHYIDKLYENIRREGFRPNKKSEHTTAGENTIRSKKSYVHKLEPLIAIGREGDIIWWEGINRMTISRILDIDKIPVQVIARHKKWQIRRDKVKMGDMDQFDDHPDLTALMTAN